MTYNLAKRRGRYNHLELLWRYHFLSPTSLDLNSNTLVIFQACILLWNRQCWKYLDWKRFCHVDFDETKSFLTDINSSMLFMHLFSIQLESQKIDGYKLTDDLYLYHENSTGHLIFTCFATVSNWTRLIWNCDGGKICMKISTSSIWFGSAVIETSSKKSTLLLKTPNHHSRCMFF